MKKMVSVFLMMLLVVTALASSAWAEGKIQPFYNQTARISASLVINGSTAECMGKIIPNSDATVSSMTMKLQQKKDGIWTTIASWLASGSKGETVSLSKTKSISKGYSYRVYVSGTVKNGVDPAETPSKTSSVKSY